MTSTDRIKVDNLIQWLRPDSFISSDISILQINSQGRSVISQADIPRGSLIMRIKKSHLLNITTVPRRNKRLSAHQQLAWFIYECIYMKKTDSESLEWTSFMDTMPSMADFKSMPLVSPRPVLPDHVIKHVEKQRKSFKKDLKHVQETTGEKLNEKQFLHSWLCVNTRCLFMDVGASEHKDNMTMAPYVDFLNHFDDNNVTVEVRMTPSSMEIYTTKDYKQGDQIYLHYGAHDNSFLLCEYGFVSKHNKWDTVDLTSAIMFLLSQKDKEKLNELGYLGDYTINRNGLSFRTEVALATILCHGVTDEVLDMISGVSTGHRFLLESVRLVEDILEALEIEWTEELKYSLDEGKRYLTSMFEDEQGD